MIERAVSYLTDRFRQPPQVAIVLGSGLQVLEDLNDAVTIPFRDIPGFPTSTVAGHAGAVSLARVNGLPVVVQRGRVHRYEGNDLGRMLFPLRVFQAMGVKTVILTNAAGGLNPGFRVADLMALRDHLYLQPPVEGPDPTRLPFVHIGWRPHPIYDPDLLLLAREVAEREEITLHTGVYAALLGPSYETPAEIEMLVRLQADAVGMSTAPEAIYAYRCGLKVLAFSCITNLALEAEAQASTSHDEVMTVAGLASSRLDRLLRGVLRSLGSAEKPDNPNRTPDAGRRTPNP